MQGVLSNNERQAGWVDTLAAAYAEVGDFVSAIVRQEEAVELFRGEGDIVRANGAGERYFSYVEGQPWRE